MFTYHNFGSPNDWAVLGGSDSPAALGHLGSPDFAVPAGPRAGRLEGGAQEPDQTPPTPTLGVWSASVFQIPEVSECCLRSLDTASRCFQKLALRITAIVQINMWTCHTGRGLFSFTFHFTVDALKMLYKVILQASFF